MRHFREDAVYELGPASLTCKGEIDPKEVSVVVQTQERETAAMLKGQEILHRPFSPMSFMEQKP